MIAPEFSRPVRLDTLGPAPRAVAIEATADERARLAARFGLLALDALAAEAVVVRAGDRIDAEGRLAASATQACVVTGEPVPATIDEPFALRFVAEAEPDGEEVELGDTDLDTIAYDGDTIDLGEAVAQGLALALDPFPRAADADATLAAAGVLSEEDAEEARLAASPFVALKALRPD